jgi:hypothetical protein
MTVKGIRMPKQYEAIRDKLAKGAPADSPEYNRAQARAAAIYNSVHPDHPVTGAHKKPIHSMAELGRRVAR